MWRASSSSGNTTIMTKELNDGIKNLLGKHVKIVFKCSVKLELKGDKTENRVLVFCPCRLFCLKIPPRMDFHFHYLEIQGIESKKPNQLVLTANDKTHSFMIPESDKVDNIDKMIVTLITALSGTFPGIPLSNIVRKLEVVPAKRLQNLDLNFCGSSTGTGSSSSSVVGTAATTPVPYPKSKSTSSLEDQSSNIPCSSNSIIFQPGSPSGSIIVESGSGSLHSSSISAPTSNNFYILPCESSSSGPCGGFSVQYAWMCDLHGLPYREEVAWDVDTIYLSHDSRELCLHDFDHLEPRDLVPILSALEYNRWFKSVKGSQVKLSHEAMERLLGVARKSLALEELHLENIGAKTDFAQKLSAALSNNANSQVHTLDLSNNVIEDKGAIHLSNPLAKLCRGPVWLNFSHCGLTAKGVAQLAHALALNRSAPNTLTHLNLSGNSLKDDINNLCSFLAQPNAVTFLDLSGTDCSLEAVFGALLRGCATNLVHLNLSRNNFSTKKGKEIPPSFKQFLTSSLTLKYLALSSCKLSLEALKQLLLGLACNESTADLELDISCNGLGQQGAHVLESCLHGIKCLASLDISDNNLDADLAGVVSAGSKNKSLKHLNLCRNLQSTKAKHVSQVMDAIVQMLQDEECVLQTLSIADSKLKGELYSVINAIGSNQCLQNIDISGNQMGDVGARLLAKAFQINSKLKSITYDRNNITLQGFSDIAYGLESNVSVRHMPYPIHDALPCVKVSAEKTEAIMKRIQELVHRNSVPKKACSGHQAFRLQQGFLLSSAQQTMDKLIAQTQEGAKLLKKADLHNPVAEVANKELINQAENLIQDSEKAKQILLSLHEMIELKADGGKVMESTLSNLADDLHSILNQHIQGNIDKVLELTEEKCPNLIGNENLKEEIKLGCVDKSVIPLEFVRHCVMDMAGTDIINKLNEVHLAVAAHLSDKLVDKAIDSLMKCHKQLSDAIKKRSSTPDVLKTRFRGSPSDLSRELSETLSVSTMMNDSNSSQYSDPSPVATPQMQSKRKGLHGRRIRPKSVVDCVEGISADDIPDLLPTLPKTIEETITSLQELPPISPQQLKHLGKARPRKPKTRAPTRPCLRPPTELIEEVSSQLNEGIDTFFRPGSTTPTPIVTPDSDECSSTSLMISITSNADDSIQSTPTHSSRTFKVDDNRSDKTSPCSFDSCSISSKLSLDTVPRSKSTDCLEKPSDNLLAVDTDQRNDDQKSPIPKHGVSVGSSVLTEMKAKQDKRSSGVFGAAKNEENSPISTGISVSETKEKFSGGQKSGVNLRKPPPVAPKPRPWSVVGSDRRSGEYSLGSDGSSPNVSAANTPDASDILDEHVGTTDSQQDRRASPLNTAPSHLSVMEKFAGLSSSPGKGESISLSPSSVSPSPSSNFHNITLHHHSLSNQNQPAAANNSVGSIQTSASGGITLNLRKVSASNNNSHDNSNAYEQQQQHQSSSSPVSLPTCGTGEKRSVKELAASLARQSARQEEVKKKADSLPRSAPVPTSSSLDQQQQDFNRARVSIQEWTRHHSFSELWKAPLKKLSLENSVSKKLAPNDDQDLKNGNEL